MAFYLPLPSIRHVHSLNNTVLTVLVVKLAPSASHMTIVPLSQEEVRKAKLLCTCIFNSFAFLCVGIIYMCYLSMYMYALTFASYLLILLPLIYWSFCYQSTDHRRWYSQTVGPTIIQETSQCGQWSGDFFFRVTRIILCFVWVRWC